MSTAIKIYVHDESTQTTKILQWQTLSNHQQQMQALKARIEQEFELKKQGKVLVDLRSENNRPIHSLKDKMDIFIVVATSSEAGNSDEKKNSRLGEENQPCKASSPPSSIVITPNQMTKPPLVSEGGSSQAHDASKKSSMERGTALLSSTPSQYELQELAKNAVQFYQAKKYRQSVEAYKKIKQANVDVMGCNNNIATVYLTANMYDRALKYLKEILKTDSLDFTTKYTKAASEEQKLELKKISASAQLDLAKCLLNLQEKEQAFTLIATVLKQDENNIEALLEYASYVYRESKDPSDALTALLRVLVVDKENKIAKELLSDIVAEKGVQILIDHISQGNKLTPAMAPGVAWMALIVKEFSCITEAVELYKLSLELAPDNISYLLNLIHTLEIDVRYADALREVKSFCEKNPNCKSGDFTSHHLLELLNQIDQLDILKDPFQNTDPIAQKYYCGEYAQQYADTWETTFIDDYGSVFWKKEETFNLKELKDTITKHRLHDNITQADLDFLAVGFTVVKICYICGFLSCLPNLIQALERERMKRELHNTQIRNEHAYFCTITQLLSQYLYKTLPVKRVDNVEENHIYLVGESHSLSSAFQVINFKGTRQLLLTKLVTGCKCFHLRENTKFYPKRNYFSCLASIPEGSRVIFMFGEIDCREGLWVSVDRFKYKNIQEGIAVIISYYIKQLLKAKEKYDLYVHPAPPVLDMTRETVKMFNAHLKSECAKHGLRYLDFLDDLLTNNGKDLKKELFLDGIHCSPNITKYLEKALNKF
ncbi:hypothetical protein FDP41_002485 [Naegleria fowleri]|uniref:Uncharacterized protein n=1 Tax=Naegleria fowleri TaxID=5763 RepID=A0A6A5BZ97_NAEFO|nr:uncharacterized protein FDP41_002485 [Naegleria fowleri]KAF0978665.1 hypothetical protein FDP41_002485 [Naegleria fowleri]